MIKGNEYYNGNMQLRYIDKIGEYYIFYRQFNDFVLTSFIDKIEGNNISWYNGHYIDDLKGVYEFLKEKRSL